jgi:hypothetical protein
MSLTADAVQSVTRPASGDGVASTSSSVEKPSSPENSPTNPPKNSPKTLDADFSFIPKTLAAKCRRLIETYHAMNGYVCLPDMLWQPELRDFIEMHKDLREIFKRSSTTRSAKRANEGFVLIATTILSLEVLASDFASWSARYPIAKRRAHAILQEYTLNSRTWLMDSYLYPRSYINPAFINALAPPEQSNGRDRAAVPERQSDWRSPAAHFASDFEKQLEEPA